MEDALPAKRARFDFYDHNEGESQKSNDKTNSTISESLAGNGGESTLTSDSGFNEFTPPHSIEDENATVASSSQSYCFEKNEFEITKEVGLENTASVDADDACSVGSTTSNLSGISDLSNISGKDWKPCAGPMSWVQQQMMKGVNPRSVLTQILGGSWQIPHGVSDFMLWHIILNMLSDPPKRERLRHINTLEDVLRLIKVCKKIIILTGAGVSVSCGIPDFRSKDGIYARLSVDFPDLPDPQAMFDIHYFRKDPRPFFKFAREIYPGQFAPSLCHRFIRLIEKNNKLLRNYTQNIDTLEQVAGIKRVIQCHGSFATATCQRCSHKVDAEVIKEDIFSKRIPMCRLCSQSPSAEEDSSSSSSSFVAKDSTRQHDASCSEEPMPNNLPSSDSQEYFNSQSNNPEEGKYLESSRSPEGYQPNRSSVPSLEPVMKPDIVFFGEGLPDEFHDRMAEDKDECDLLIVIGSSLKVRPVALIPSSIPPNVPQILINREPLSHLTFDVELLGDCDVIVSELCRRLGDCWNELRSGDALSEIQELPPRSSETADGDASGSPPPLPPSEAPHPKDETDIEALRACWAPKVKESMAARLPDGKFLYCGGHRYVFPGAEVYYDPDDEDSDSSSGSESNEDVEEVGPNPSLPIGAENPPDALKSAAAESSSSSFHPRLSASSESVQSDAEGAAEPRSSSALGLVQGQRRNSQALSEDVDSLLSATSGDPTNNNNNNNTPDHPSEGQWGCAHTIPIGELSNPTTTPNSMVEDWTNLSASLDGTSSTQPEEVEGHFEISSQKGKGQMGAMERRDGSLAQAPQCLV